MVWPSLLYCSIETLSYSHSAVSADGRIPVHHGPGDRNEQDRIVRLLLRSRHEAVLIGTLTKPSQLSSPDLPSAPRRKNPI